MSETLRLLMPQWQGGNNPAYALGAELLAWLAPAAGETPQVEVPVEPHDGTDLPVENGVVARSALLRQLRSARHIIEAHSPKRVIVFGGDCHVAQAPFAYLNELYDGKLGVLWIDSHPDVSTPEMYCHEHAMVLGNLLGEGDPDFSAEVKRPLKPELVMYAGLQKTLRKETEILDRLKLRSAFAKELAADTAPVLQWIEHVKIQVNRHVLYALVLDPLQIGRAHV